MMEQDKNECMIKRKAKVLIELQSRPGLDKLNDNNFKMEIMSIAIGKWKMNEILVISYYDT